MRAESASPLAALKRKVRGPRGQAPGTITTDPKEVDEIVREAYGKIYAGNVKDVDKMIKKYLKDYKEFIFEGKESEIEDITAEDIHEEFGSLKESAAGMDQWAPADLTLLPMEVCRRLAQMFNAIEKGAAWPEAMSVARAAFMAKEEGIELDPLSYRVLLMLPSAYRLYAKIRLSAAMDRGMGDPRNPRRSRGPRSSGCGI